MLNTTMTHWQQVQANNASSASSHSVVQTCYMTNHTSKASSRCYSKAYSRCYCTAQGEREDTTLPGRIPKAHVGTTRVRSPAHVGNCNAGASRQKRAQDPLVQHR
jgi:hypothetical protein